LNICVIGYFECHGGFVRLYFGRRLPWLISRPDIVRKQLTNLMYG
jgi:hypothetical protein